MDYDSHVVVLESWEEFCANLDKKMVIMAPFCGEIPCEDLVKKTSARSDSKVMHVHSRPSVVLWDSLTVGHLRSHSLSYIPAGKVREGISGQ